MIGIAKGAEYPDAAGNVGCIEDSAFFAAKAGHHPAKENDRAGQGGDFGEKGTDPNRQSGDAYVSQ